jgi:hypothetical protein
MSDNFKFEREDWTSFRTIDGLQQKAGVPKGRLARLVLKELADNSLDAGGKISSLGELPKGGYFIEDNGPGIGGSSKDIARLFSIRRPQMSSKYLRRPQRGMLGNGLRVVAGAVLASEGSLAVTTRNRRIVLRPKRDGDTTVVSVSDVKFPRGTRIEISFGPALSGDDKALAWAKTARVWASFGTSYTGKSSPWWYDAPSFYELIESGTDRPVRELIAQLDGCTDTAGEIVTAAGVSRTMCKNVTREQAGQLLEAAQYHAKPVTPKQLGAVGRLVDYVYACERGETYDDDIPFVVEAWAKTDDKMSLMALVNRTPVTGDIYARRDKRDIDIIGCGLAHAVATAPADVRFNILLNITTPYMSITSDGKEPDLEPFLDEIRAAVTKAVRKAHRPVESSSELLPKRRRGRQGPEAEAQYREQVKRFCRLILQIQSTMDFKVGSRGWCYLLEHHGLRKGDFDAGQTLITACRKSGDLPMDTCAEDVSRDTIGVEEIDSCDVPNKVNGLIDHLANHVHETYLPISLWDDLDVYVEVATEKLDLRNLFEPVCRELHVPITNFKGWSDFNARARVRCRFKYWEARGKKCFLLVCGDHDPGGLLITQTLRKNLEDLAGAVGWSPTNLIISRFGLNEDFIDEHDLTWIDNLETSSGKQLDDENHHDHNRDYVQDYITMYGVRKCEANALVVVPDIARQLCRDAILEHIPIAAVGRYEHRLARHRQELKAALAERIS